MRLIPADTPSSSFSHTTPSASAPSAPGLHDTLRAGVGPKPVAAATVGDNKPAALDSSHPLEARLKNWDATQEALRMETLRRMYGMAEPIRQAMELKIVQDTTWRPAALGAALPSVHEEILRARDSTVTWEDVYPGDLGRSVVGVHDEMERKLKM
ncbi:related to 20S proteasome maturation factor [Cephalotrichum gorgonifer]|uniref:Related to 20S proteasome maturation factor n=1 Tax=Cephalotrichum gorgonifer TaxID=2041049 RepID=A0AAE8N1A3_9PEZI|nr:related to 20S proteasome maturation factor [Cephalotrichum gorgonifer]